MFKNEQKRLYYVNDGETVCVEPWGENTLRVRASRNRIFTEQDWALEEPAEHHGTVEIFEDASADGMAYANMYMGKDSSYGTIRNGKIRAVINADGVLSFEKEDGTVLLKENWRRLQDEISAPLNLFGREYRPGDGENYETTLRSFMKFRRGEDLLLDEINSDLMVDYEVWLRQNGVSMNTSSFYMRNLRSVYNKAVEKKLVFQMNPFRHVYTGIDKTVKRAVSLKTIRQLFELDFSRNPKLEYVRDLFMFSFYTRGMAFVDMAYLRKSDLKQGILTYRRRKTGQLLCIRWEECMQKIVHKYEIKESIYLLPIIKDEEMERKQYKNASHLVNLRLKSILKFGNRS